MTKRVLITGITGMAGSHLADYLIAEQPDLEITGLKRWRSDTSTLAHLSKKIELIDCDLTDPLASLKVFRSVKPDIVFHLAAQSYVVDSWKNPTATVLDNVTMELNIFEAARACDLDPIIQIALSSEEFGKVLAQELPIREQNAFRPLSPYAVSKVLQDVLAYQYSESYKMKTIRTIAFNHEGPRRGEVFVTSNFAKQIVEIEMGLREPVIYVGNLSAQRDWIDVRDVVRAYWLATQHCTPGEQYVIATGVARTVEQMLQTLLSLTSVKVETRVDPERLRPSDVMVLQGDSTKFRQATGWTPAIPFEATMRDTLNYWRQRLEANSTADSASTSSA